MTNLTKAQFSQKRDRTQKALLKAEQERAKELERFNAELQQTLNLLAESEERYRALVNG